MGPKQSTETSPSPINKKDILEKITKSSFEYISIIGKGGFGKVWKVYSRKQKTQFALKEMSKAKIIDKHSEKSVKYERDLLGRMHHPYASYNI